MLWVCTVFRSWLLKDGWLQKCLQASCPSSARENRAGGFPVRVWAPGLSVNAWCSGLSDLPLNLSSFHHPSPWFPFPKKIRKAAGCNYALNVLSQKVIFVPIAQSRPPTSTTATSSAFGRHFVIRTPPVWVNVFDTVPCESRTGLEILEACCLRSGCSLGWEQCHAPCGDSQPLSTSIQAPWLLLVSLYISSSLSRSKMLWTGGIPSLRALCVHTHFKQLSLDPELSPDPKANMTFDNLPLRSPYYFRTMMYLEVSACPCVCSYSDTLLSALSWVSLLRFLSFWRGDVDTVCSSETGGNSSLSSCVWGLKKRCDTCLLVRICAHFVLFFWTDLVLCLMWLILCGWPLLRAGQLSCKVG